VLFSGFVGSGWLTNVIASAARQSLGLGILRYGEIAALRSQ